MKSRWHAGVALVLLCGSALAAPLDVNVANQAELEQIKGLGPQRVEQVLAERRQAGPFHDWADFSRRIKGIGPATARKLSQAGLVVAGQPYTPEAQNPNQ